LIGGNIRLKEIRPAEFESAKLKRARVNTSGPDGGFGAVLFIEKEGFQPLFERVGLSEQHDIAIMSTKGVSVTAARMLVDEMCGEHNIPLLVLHDFDVAGFTILELCAVIQDAINS
jgi:DNA topoisomerase VI subunit A